jgi:hypothetical protein
VKKSAIFSSYFLRGPLQSKNDRPPFFAKEGNDAKMGSFGEIHAVIIP